MLQLGLKEVPITEDDLLGRMARCASTGLQPSLPFKFDDCVSDNIHSRRSDNIRILRNRIRWAHSHHPFFFVYFILLLSQVSLLVITMEKLQTNLVNSTLFGVWAAVAQHFVAMERTQSNVKKLFTSVAVRVFVPLVCLIPHLQTAVGGENKIYDRGTAFYFVICLEAPCLALGLYRYIY